MTNTDTLAFTLVLADFLLRIALKDFARRYNLPYTTR